MNNFFKNSVITFFSVSLFLSVLIQTFMLVNYYVNQEEYTDKYCVNKARPELNCKGSCHLSEQLKLTNKTSNQNSNKVFSVVVSVIAFQEIKEVELAMVNKQEQKLSYAIESYKNNRYLSPIFKPPIFI